MLRSPNRGGASDIDPTPTTGGGTTRRGGSSSSSSSSSVRSRCVFVTVGVLACCFFFELGAWQMGGARGDLIHKAVNKLSSCGQGITLQFQTHHRHQPDGTVRVSTAELHPCHPRYAHHHPSAERRLPSAALRCIISPPPGYLSPFSWPKCRNHIPSANLPNLNRSDGEVYTFPAEDADSYSEELSSVIPIDDGTVRTALDIGCGVGGWGAYLFERNVLTMSFGSDDHVQFALERGVPAVIGSLGTLRLPYPSRSFDMVRCAHCLVPWTSHDGMYLMEVDRVLRPGGYWILSGPPVNWQTNFKTWERSVEELDGEQKKIEDIARLLCWEKKYEADDIAIWSKNISDPSCQRKEDRISVETCDPSTISDILYKKMTACITPFPKASNSNDIVTGGKLKKFPKRLFAIPPRVAQGYVPGVTTKIYRADKTLWKKYVTTYKKINEFIGTTRYRNMMDMNAGLGGFSAELEPNSWVMNVVPTVSDKDTLGIIYERGLIGIYHNWCEAFSTYPRTYDLIHANGLFSLYHTRCKMEDILLEMDRILRPEGAVIFRDDVDILSEVKNIVHEMRWDTKMFHHEDGPGVSEKIMMAVKRYWVSAGNSTSS